jgi:hypothetical protein
MLPAFASEPAFSTLIRRVRTREPVVIGGLSVVALCLDAAGGPDADLLEEGLEQKTTSLREVSESGVVAKVRVDHQGARVLLLVDGEQLIGAKQNRIVNSSFLVASGTSVELPVSCVERGRWRDVSKGFSASGTTLSVTARREKLKRVTTSLRTSQTFDADQNAVWRDVDSYLERTGVRSHTSAFDDAYQTRSSHVETTLEGLAPVPGQVGIAAVRGNELIGLDLFGSAALYSRAWRKVARGLLAEVFADPTDTTNAKMVVDRALEALARAPASATTPPGCGTTHHGEAGGTTFTALEHEQALYHLTAASI